MKSRPLAIAACVLSVLVSSSALQAASYPATALEKRIKALTDKLGPELIDIRRDLHAHPELGLEEVRTSGIVADYFRKLGLEVRTGYAKTGILGILRGGRPGPVVAIRGDMDALPITEETGLPFASQVKAVVDGRETGLMHACGHDIHTTVLLGVAAVLSALKADLPGTVVFVAQPAEELSGSVGARSMIAEGAFKDVVPAAFFAYHVADNIKTGKIGYIPGFASANVDGFRLIIKSKGCHGSTPDLCVDPIVVGAQIVTALQVMVAREIDVQNHTVVTVGSFHAGTASNIIPDSAELWATVRTYGDDQRRALEEKITRLVTGICGAAGAPFDLSYERGSPSMYSDPRLLAAALATAERVLGGKSAIVEERPEMGGEDFSCFGKIAPALMLNLGVVAADVEETAVHSPTFVADEDSIAIGVGLMAQIVLDHQLRRAKEAGQ